MTTLKFKTNVNCGGCIANVMPHLNKVKGIISWKVDISTPLKIMTVETEDINAEVIISTMKEAGYKADLIL